VALSPRTIPTPIMCPNAPKAKVSVAVKPAGSPVCRPESLSTSLSPAVDFLFAEGASPNLPANNNKVVDATMICTTEHHKSLKHTFRHYTFVAPNIHYCNRGASHYNIPNLDIF
jgi:hypothetical protein